jgi:hypothetical protein
MVPPSPGRGDRRRKQARSSRFGSLWLRLRGGATAIVLGSYFLARRILPPDADDDRTHDVAGSVAFRIAALHGLILGQVYPQDLGDYKDVRTALTEEAIAVTDVYNDMLRYGGMEVVPVQSGLKRYVATVVGEGWDMLGRAIGLSPLTEEFRRLAVQRASRPTSRAGLIAIVLIWACVTIGIVAWSVTQRTL